MQEDDYLGGGQTVASGFRVSVQVEIKSPPYSSRIRYRNPVLKQKYDEKMIRNGKAFLWLRNMAWMWTQDPSPGEFLLKKKTTTSPHPPSWCICEIPNQIYLHSIYPYFPVLTIFLMMTHNLSWQSASISLQLINITRHEYSGWWTYMIIHVNVTHSNSAILKQHAAVLFKWSLIWNFLNQTDERLYEWNLGRGNPWGAGNTIPNTITILIPWGPGIKYYY